VHTTSLADLVMQRCDQLAQCSEQPDGLMRRFCSPAMQQAQALLTAWMQAAGMLVRRDAIGNLMGRYEAATPNAKTLLLGSHLDSVSNAGKYDGPLGILVALACVEHLHQQGRRLPFAIELLAFADEEGVRYHSTYLGSQVVAGCFDPQQLHLTDADGISMADAIRAFGGDPERLHEARRASDDLLGYVEVHIEQGPVLENLGLPVGIVTAIAGQTRTQIQFAGTAGHAGTVPMALRQDALCAAAEFVLAAEALARELDGLVATVGRLEVQPNVPNVIPGSVRLSLDLRHQDDQRREQAQQQLHQTAQQIAQKRRVALQWQIVQSNPAVPCTPTLTTRLAQAVEHVGLPVHHLPSGAGHDGVVMSKIAPIAMLFVRCKGGISHNPAESVDADDVRVAIDVLEQLLLSLAE